MAFLPVQPHCANARLNRYQEEPDSFPLEELETTRTPSYYVDEDYTPRLEIQQPLPE